jgi:hypothetical protein
MEIFYFVIKFLIYLLVASPICMVLHELGHASMILALTKQKVSFQMGVRGLKREFLLGRITILIYFEPSALFFCRYRLENKADLTWYQDFGITIGGPLTSLIFTIVCLILWWVSNGADPWTGLTIINFLNFLNTSIPAYYPKWQGIQGGIPTDGLQLVQLLKQSRA